MHHHQTGIIVEWEEGETESGIKLDGPTKVVRRGEVISSHAYPMSGAGGAVAFMVALVVRRLDTNEIIVINGLGAKVVSAQTVERLCKGCSSK